LELSEFVGIKGWKAMGNKIGEFTISKIEQTNNIEFNDDNESSDNDESDTETDYSSDENKQTGLTNEYLDDAENIDSEAIEEVPMKKDKKSDNSLHIGDTIEF